MQTEVRSLLGSRVIGADGEEIGKVGQVYISDHTGRPEWLTVRTGLFGLKQTFVPLMNSRRSNEGIYVPFDKDTIKHAPNIDVDGDLSAPEEAELYRYYGMRGIPTQSRSEQGMGQGKKRGSDRDTTSDRDMGRTGDLDMTRSEEEMHVGKERHEAGRVHLHKYVDTENVQRTVPLERDRVVVDREPITDGDEMLGTGEISEDEETIVVYEERPVQATETRPVERVHIRREKERHDETVEGQVRRERIEVEEEGRPLDRGDEMHSRDVRRDPMRDSTGDPMRDDQDDLPPER
ncbi:PRC and DUF2382 domain-containing protein [Nonomuraea rhizosphaerae]|uniref:PRC and DUF2382 domain-containing protein n=1 Tax=Nonomuraea rhizosphaerae TaxID=2665663 RepID=UPI001FED1A9D|nr:PRC and DUF2382 domain-containing protein [Nonomuraea rhizosphaerae]